MKKKKSTSKKSSIPKKGATKKKKLTSKPSLLKKTTPVTKSISKEKSIDKLVASESKYRAVMEHSPHAMFIGLAKGGFLESNPAACAMFGYSELEFKTLGREQLFVHDAAFLKKLSERAKDGSVKGEEGTGIRKNGEHFPCEISSSIFKDSDGTLMSISIISDITTRKKTENLLKNTNQLARVGGWELDLINNNLYWTSVTKEIYETSDDYVPELNDVLKFIKEGESRTVINQGMDSALNKGEPVHLEFQIITAKGNERWIKLTGKPEFENKKLVRFLGAVQDITDLKVTALELEKSRQRYKSLFDNSPDIILSTDLAGRIQEANGGAANSLECSVDEMIGMKLEQFATPESLKQLEKDLKKVLNRKPVNGASAIITAKGNKKTILTSLAPLIDNNQVIGISAIAKDITVLENYQHELEFQARLLNTIKQAVIVVNREGNITYWNDFATRLYGWRRKEVLGQPVIGIIISEQSHEDAEKIMQKLSSGEPWSGEFAVRKKTNERFIVHAVNSPIMDDQGQYNGTIGVSFDVTEEVIAREQIKLQARLLDSVEEAVIASDFDNKIIYWNKHAEKMYGWTKEEALGKTIITLDNSDSITQAEATHAMQAVQQGNSWSGEFKAKSKNGNVFPVFTSISPVIDNNEKSIGIISVSHDITKQKEEEAIKEIEELDKETLINATQDYMWSIDKDFKLLAANQAVIQMIKSQSGKEFKRGDIFDLHGLYPDGYAQFFTTIQKRGLAGESITSEFKSPVSNRWYELTVRPIIKDGKILGVACYNKNITQQKYLSEKLEQRAHELQESNSELERFAYVASHDLQEPLRMVSSFLMLLEKGYKNQLDATAQKYIHFAVDGATRMKQLIADLLEYSRAGTQAVELTDTDMNEVLKDVLNVLRVTIKETDASIICNPLPVLPKTRRTQMAQLMQNLIGNALKYRGSEKPEIYIDAIENEDHWILAVKDNGIGFESTNAERIFDVFQRLHNATEYSGTGIGLSICKKIVERHGGKIWAESTPGVGSTFYFSIPKTPKE